MTQPYTLLYILGSGHCGSTLLDLMLNGHPLILGLGEIGNMKKDIVLAKETQDPLLSILHTPFWIEVKKCYEKTSETPFDQFCTNHDRWKNIRSWPLEDIERWSRPNELLFSCIHQIKTREISGVKILTDTSKSAHRLYLLQRSGLFNIKVIHLMRDGHAVVNSYIRSYGDLGMALRRWAVPTLLALYMRRKFARADWLQVRYEDLATRPETMLQSICAFLDINFEPKMLNYRSYPYVGIRGNPMRARGDERIFLDERWKQEMNRKHRLAFTITAGWLNKLYRY